MSAPTLPPPTRTLGTGSDPCAPSVERAIPAPVLFDGLAPGPQRSRAILVIALVLAIAGGLAWWWFAPSGTPGDEPSAPIAALDETDPFALDARAASTDEAPSGGSDSIGQIGADAIDSAGEIAGAIEPTDDETALLAELGLDETGIPIASPEFAAGHRFTWVFADGSTVGVVVDHGTGDHEYVDDTGRIYRQVGDRGFARADEASAWVPVDPSEFDGLDRFGLTRPLQVDDLIGGPVAGHVTPVGADAVRLDADALGVDHPEVRRAWLSLVGLDPIATGPVEMTIEVHLDGSTLESATIVRVATAETVTYTLDEIYDIAPTIEPPTG